MVWEEVTGFNWFASVVTARRVPIPSLIGTQRSVVVKGLVKRDRRRILVVSIRGKNYIRDGHHRVTRAIMRGQKTIGAYVVTL